MSPSAKIQSLIDEGFVVFTFGGITTNINARGEEKKTPLGMPNWQNITPTNHTQYISPSHTATAIITGQPSNISVIDFDDIAEYNKLVSNHPEVKNHRTIKTKNGVHIYCLFNPQLKTSTNAFKSYQKVDIRSDNAIVFAPPTTYKLKDGTIAKYEDLGGQILPVPNFILDDIKRADAPASKSAPAPAPAPAPAIHLNAIRTAIREGKLNTKSNGSYDDWRDVGFVIHHTSNSEEGRQIFHEFSRLNTDKYDETYTDSFWRTIKHSKDKPLTIATFYWWIRPIKTANTDLEAANILYDELKDRLKSYDRRLFYYINNIWVCDERVEDALLDYIMNSGIKSKGAKEGTFIPFVENISKAQNVLKTLTLMVRTKNNDPDLYHKFHSTTKGKLCFEDGVLDFISKRFTKWEQIPPFTIFSTQKIARNFADTYNKPPLEYMKHIQSSLFEPKYGDKIHTFYHFASRAIAGHCEDKRWGTYLGNRNCGKGVEYDLFKSAFGSYVTTFELSNLLYSRKTAGLENMDCTKKSAWMMDLEFCRLAISQEIPSETSGLVLNGKTLKKITGGKDELVARRNYDRFDTHFFSDATFYAQGNSGVQYDTPDCQETLVEFSSVVEYVSQAVFDSKTPEEQQKRYRVADPNIKDKCQTTEWANALIWMLFTYYKDTSVPIVRDDMNETIDVPQLLEEMFELTHNNEDIVACEDVFSMLPDYNKKKITLELSVKNIHKKKCEKKGVLRGRYCFFGMKKRVVEGFEGDI